MSRQDDALGQAHRCRRPSPRPVSLWPPLYDAHLLRAAVGSAARLVEELLSAPPVPVSHLDSLRHGHAEELGDKALLAGTLGSLLVTALGERLEGLDSGGRAHRVGGHLAGIALVVRLVVGLEDLVLVDGGVGVLRALDGTESLLHLALELVGVAVLLVGAGEEGREVDWVLVVAGR